MSSKACKERVSIMLEIPGMLRLSSLYRTLFLANICHIDAFNSKAPKCAYLLFSHLLKYNYNVSISLIK